MTNSASDHPARPAPDKLQGFIASLPGMACQIQLLDDGTIGFPYASEGCQALLGVPAESLREDSRLFLDRIHADDIPAFLESLKHSAQTLSFWNWEGRLMLGDTLKWISLGATPRSAEGGLPRWEGIVLDITQNKLSELEVKQAQQQLLELSSHIQDAKEEERLRIAREVHDEIGSLLTAIKIDFSWLKQRLPKDNETVQERVHTFEDLINKVIAAASNLAHSLRPGFLDYFGLIAALEIEAQEFSKRSGIPCTLNKSDDSIELPDSISITLFRIFQETLNNILKHAKASHVEIEIVKGEDHLELIIADNGVGFDDSARKKPRSFGLRGMQERVTHLGGTATIASTPGCGTQIAIFIPLEPQGETAPASAQQQALFDDVQP